MAVFSYIGLTKSGKEIRDQIEAASEREVVRLLKEQHIIAVKIKEGIAFTDGGVWKKIKKVLSMLSPGQYGPIRAADLIILFRQLALMIRAGYTLVTALDACLTMIDKVRLKRSITRMSDEIRRGSTFSQMLKKETKIFTPMVANLVAAGEQSGDIDSILERLADSLEQSVDLKRQMVTAMAYPSIVLLAAIGVVLALVFLVIPKFATFLESQDSELPKSTQLLMDVSALAIDYALPFSVIFGASIFLILAAYTTKKGKKSIDGVMLYIPVVGKAILFSAMAQAGWSLSMLLQSGVTALEALRITTGIVANSAVSHCFKDAAEGLLEGKPLSKCFEQPHIPNMMRHMAAVGESSGQLDGVMEDVGEFYKKELEAKVKFIAAMVEPCLILGIGGMVGFVYIAFFSAVMAASNGGM